MCGTHSSREAGPRVVVALCLVFAGLLTLGWTTSAEADNGAGDVAAVRSKPPVDAAPAVATDLLRGTARAEFESFLIRLPVALRRKLVGAYLAFDDSLTDIDSMIGCDDDGDYVVVVTDALLGLASFVGKAEAADETCQTHKVLDYARYLAEFWRSQPKKAVRPPPPPPGFFDGSPACSLSARNLEGARFAEIVGAVVARELTRLVQGELVCPNPTATHERGDDLWTREEQEQSLARELEHDTADDGFVADRDATTRILDMGLTERGSLAWLRMADQVEVTLRDSSSGGRGAMQNYLRLHPDSRARVEAVRAAAGEWQRAHNPTAIAPAPAGVSWTTLPIAKIRLVN